MHSRALASALSCHKWHDTSRRTCQAYNSLNATTYRHASTKTASSQKRKPDARTPSPSSTNRSTPSKSHTPKPNAANVRPWRTTSIAFQEAKERVNPPDFTYAPPIDVPARKPDQGTFKYYYSVARAYLSFYKTGVSHVRQTLRYAKTLRKKVAEAAKQHANEPSTKVLSRAEWQVLRRSGRDRLRLPAFGVLLFFLGEWLPVLVIYMTPLVPEACRIPQQVLRTRKAIEKRREQRLRVVELKYQRLLSSGKHMTMAREASIKWERMSALFDCHARVWDWVFGPPQWVLALGVDRKMQYLRTDDGLIARDGGWPALNKEEVERACIDRGFPVLGKEEAELRGMLAGWKGIPGKASV